MYSFSQLGLKTVLEKQEENRTIWNGNETCFGLKISCGHITNGGVNIDKTLLDHTNEIENLEEMVKRLNTEFAKLKGNKNTGRGNESCWLDEIDTPLCPFIRFKNKEDRELSIDRTLQVQTSKIGNLVELVKRSIKELNAWKENNRTQKGNERCLIETSATFNLIKANKEIMAKALHVERIREEQQEEIANLRQLVERLTSERDIQQGKVKACEERHHIMRTQENKIKMEAVDFKNEILQCKKQINDLTIKSSRYQTFQTKYKETRMNLKSIENEKQLLDAQLIVKTAELARMKQTVNELKAHEEMSIKLSKEKKKLEKEMSNVKKRLKEMSTRVQDTSKLLDENELLHNSIESLKMQIKDKDAKIQKCKLEYKTILGELATQQSENSKILKFAKRSDQRFKRKRTIKDREILKEEFIRAKNNEKQHTKEAKLWVKRSKRMRSVVKAYLTDNDETSSQDSYSESSDDSCVQVNSKLPKTSVNGIVHSNKDKLQKSLNLRQDSKKEINIINITNLGTLTHKSNITHHSNDALNEDNEPRAIEECDE